MAPKTVGRRKQTSAQEGPRRASNGARRRAAAKAIAAPDSEDDKDINAATGNDQSEEDADEYNENETEDVKSLDSDALDDDSDVGASSKRKRGSPRKRKPSISPKKATPRKKRKKSESDDDDDPGEDLEVVGKIVQAPTKGRVPPGQISRITLDFLTKLKDPACNDRVWFKLHEPVYRVIEKEFKDFIEAFTEGLTEVDAQIPPLPPKDLIHRIYRDIRFSNDKTPYKRGLSASLSRSGRKGVFAGYHVLVKPGNESLLAAGSWCPGKNELATIRSHILRSSDRLRSILSAPEFVRIFGLPHPHPKGQRQNIFGMDDELKVAPKGIDKNHKDIDLLKCRSFAVSTTFTDEQVLRGDFQEELMRAARVMQPLVHCLNDMMTVSPDELSDDQDNDDN